MLTKYDQAIGFLPTSGTKAVPLVAELGRDAAVTTLKGHFHDAWWLWWRAGLLAFFFAEDPDGSVLRGKLRHCQFDAASTLSLWQWDSFMPHQLTLD